MKSADYMQVLISVVEVVLFMERSRSSDDFSEKFYVDFRILTIMHKKFVS